MYEIKCCSYILVKKIKVILYLFDGVVLEMLKEYSIKCCDYRCCCCIKNFNNKIYFCVEVVFIFDKLI